MIDKEQIQNSHINKKDVHKDKVKGTEQSERRKIKDGRRGPKKQIHTIGERKGTGYVLKEERMRPRDMC